MLDVIDETKKKRKKTNKPSHLPKLAEATSSSMAANQALNSSLVSFQEFQKVGDDTSGVIGRNSSRDHSDPEDDRVEAEADVDAFAVQTDENETDDEDNKIELPTFLITPSFRCFVASPVTYIDCTRITTSDVMSTSVTIRATSTFKVKKKPGKFNGLALPTRNLLPALNIPAQRMNKKLILERDRFMAKLKQDRENRMQLEDWAATKIQSMFRGYLVRPKQMSLDKKNKRKKVFVMGITRPRNDLETFGKQRPDYISDINTGSNIEWRRNIHNTAKDKRDARGKRNESEGSATLIQATYRGYLARIGYHFLLLRHHNEVYARSVVRIQSCFRGFVSRHQTKRILRNRREKAALRIQCLVRGTKARERVQLMRIERGTRAKDVEAATTMQKVIRGHQAKTRVSFIQMEKEAIETIQRVAKGHYTRVQLRKRKELKEKKAQQEHASATKIQAIIRGRRTREKSAVTTRGVYRIEPDQQMVPTLLTEEASAVKIQSIARGRQARAKVGLSNKKDQSIVKNQSMPIGRQSPSKVENQSHQTAQAATKIQSIVRGHRDRAKIKKQFAKDQSTKPSQSIARGKRERPQKIPSPAAHTWSIPSSR